jgi:hypothetical protein
VAEVVALALPEFGFLGDISAAKTVVMEGVKIPKGVPVEPGHYKLARLLINWWSANYVTTSQSPGLCELAQPATYSCLVS